MMGKQTHRLSKDEELQSKNLYRWIIQVFKPGIIGEWVHNGRSSEWIAAHPYTAVAQSLLGDDLRKPLQIVPNEMVRVNRSDEPNTFIWLTATDIMIIADEIASLSNTLGGV
jgi:hypothetical protein